MPSPPRPSRSALLLAGALILTAGRGPCADAQPPSPATADSAGTPGTMTGASTGAVGAPSPADAARLAEAADVVRRARALEARADADGAVAGVLVADSARLLYERAAQLVPAAADWLRLRALTLAGDADARARLRSTIDGAAARERVAAAEAEALVRAGDRAGAAAAWEALGADGTAATLRLADATATGDAAARARVRDVLATLVRAGATRGANALPAARTVGAADRADVREAAAALDSAFAPLPATERLLVARALAEVGGGGATLARAARAFDAALAAGAGEPTDRATYGAVLARLGRWRDAAAQYARAPGGNAAYQSARARLRAGDAAGAQAGLRRVLADFPNDADAAASARYLQADLALDAGRETEARTGFLAVASSYPQSTWAPLAAFRGALLALTAGDARAAAAALDAAAARWPQAAERTAAAYWAGRAWERAGDAARARERWDDVLAREPASYYAGLAARRLGRAAWAPPEGPLPAAAPDERATAAATAQRAALLERLGLGAEAGYERDWLARWADGSVPRQLGAAAALQAGGRPGPSIRLAARAVEEGAPRVAATYRLLNPLLYGDALRREADARGVEPALAAALVKQESNFTADAVSPAGARGLMQVMPAVGRSLWTARDAAAHGAWSAARLFDPDVNLALGMRHLRASLGAWPHPAYALAAYNAGGSRVRRWRASAGSDDPELFVERIPFEETRDYVRIVLRGRELYRVLYAGELDAR
jgi:soluble lytic murein transglycosylase